MALSWVQPAHLPSSGLLCFQFIYHSSAGLSTLEHKFAMSLNISDPCLPSGHDHHALHCTHLPSLQRTAMSGGFSPPAFLPPFLVHHPAGPPVLGEQSLHFHLYIPSIGLCPAHRVSTRAPMQLIASSPTTNCDFFHPLQISYSMNSEDGGIMTVWRPRRRWGN